ncbi:sugar phosphate isomerase/epimerase [Paenarthrobacter sp. Z7-10]|uniref:sugar phosphate isomerase/epimerase family protein n=1 Tax=Paenarthrobacter sp. Z7-10 TaxID=2787635 RepID=UPI0022A9221B|nr:TIM barrel protein [Paenarthrobacter sp. Z7-10]MCZ2404596.1 sugar phosphate isomerase/epimerase [Paenarthrobacter sp. Z7-10]
MSDLPAGTLTPGVCSVTLRADSIEQVVEASAAAGLAGIEWGTDVHLRDTVDAVRAARATVSAGLRVLSLGSYYRVGSAADFDAVLAIARAAAAPRIRVWAGDMGSAQSGPDIWSAVVADARRIGRLAAVHEMDLAFEYHGGTLTDSAESTLELLERVGCANIGTYWQPPVGMPDQEALVSLHKILAHVIGVHAFSWWPETERLPLSGRSQLWHEASGALRSTGRNLDVLLEFVADDSPAQLLRDAAYLRRLGVGEA